VRNLANYLAREVRLWKVWDGRRSRVFFGVFGACLGPKLVLFMRTR